MEHHVDDLDMKNHATNKHWARVTNRLAKFRQDERGSMIVFSLFMLILMLMVSGMAVDLMRAETQRARLQSTLDRAVLAGASLNQALDSEAVVRDYFAKAGLSDYLTKVKVTPGDNSKSVEASAFMEVDSYFMNMLGINTLSAPAGGTAEESLSDIEISLVVDVSGSMGSYSSSGRRKIADLILAASDFVYLMQCNPDDAELDEAGNPVCTVDPDTVSVSLIPYAEQVSVGKRIMDEFLVTNEHSASYCMDFPTLAFSSTSISLSDVQQRTGNHDARSRSNDSTASDLNRTCQTQDYRTITPFGDDWEVLQTKIEALNYGGYTSIDLGMKWGTAMLDPAFRPVVNKLATTGAKEVIEKFKNRPFDFKSRGMQKVVVLMTDGINTSQYELKDGFRSGPSPLYYNADEDVLSVYQADTDDFTYMHDGSTGHPVPYGDEWGNNNYTLEDVQRVCTGRGWSRTCWYETTYTEVHPTGTVGQMTYPEVWEKYPTQYFDALPGMDNPVTMNESNKNSRLDTICSEAKDAGIEVFTIGFETSYSSSLVMKSCASSESHHFDATGLNLSAAFTSIAREIHELRLTH